jgi:hypothetical protein
MRDMATRALAGTVDALAAREGVRAHLCEGSAADAVVWGSDGLTVRLAARGKDEIWVLAGLCIFARVVADSEGGFDDVEPLVLAILDGRAREFLVDFGSGLVPAGWEITVGEGGLFAGGADAGLAGATVVLRGHLANLTD